MTINSLLGYSLSLHLLSSHWKFTEQMSRALMCPLDGQGHVARRGCGRSHGLDFINHQNEQGIVPMNFQNHFLASDVPTTSKVCLNSSPIISVTRLDHNILDDSLVHDFPSYFSCVVVHPWPEPTRISSWYLHHLSVPHPTCYMNLLPLQLSMFTSHQMIILPCHQFYVCHIPCLPLLFLQTFAPLDFFPHNSMGSDLEFMISNPVMDLQKQTIHKTRTSSSVFRIKPDSSRNIIVFHREGLGSHHFWACSSTKILYFQNISDLRDVPIFSASTNGVLRADVPISGIPS